MGDDRDGGIVFEKWCYAEMVCNELNAYQDGYKVLGTKDCWQVVLTDLPTGEVLGVL